MKAFFTLFSLLIATNFFAQSLDGSWQLTHENGHTFQSQRLGLSYLFGIGIPSVVSAAGSGDHGRRWYEIQANRWA